MVHNPNYDFNDEIVTVGDAYWVALTRRFLAAQTGRLTVYRHARQGRTIGACAAPGGPAPQVPGDTHVQTIARSHRWL